MEELDKATLFIKLKELNVERITIDFSGSGDSGSIDAIRLLDLDDNEIDNNGDLNESIEELGYDILENSFEYDWYNNEGGSGELTINLNDLKWSIEAEINEMISHSVGRNGKIN